MIENAEKEPQMEKPRLFVQWVKGLGEYWISVVGVDDFDVQNKIAEALSKSKLNINYTVESRGSRVEVMPRKRAIRKDEDVLKDIEEVLGEEYVLPSTIV